MVTITGGGNLERYLTRLSRKLERGGRVLIGFPEGATYPDGTAIALVAAVNEFGAPSRGIPPRPFIRVGTIAKHSKEWGEETGAALKAYDMDPAKALGAMGELIAGEMREAIIELADPPNAASTIRAKGSDSPLVDTGQMLASVTSWVEDGQ